jgi:hypothetical protein
VTVKIVGLTIQETCRNFYGPVDSLGKLFYKGNVKKETIGIVGLAERLRTSMQE